MLGVVAAGALAVALTGCAYISGPCSLDAAQRRLECAPGGVFILWRPAATIEAIRDTLPGPPEGPRLHERDPPRYQGSQKRDEAP